MNFRIGAAVWAYKGWVGDFYPAKSQASDFLHLYGQRFTAVEGNTTFYHIPDRDTIAKWVAQTPTGFKFCPKLPRQITHNGMLAEAIAPAISFIELMQELGDRLGIIFIQLPPAYSPGEINDLRKFLRALVDFSSERLNQSSKLQLAVEVRHRDWYVSPHCDRLNELLQQLGIGRVLLDSRPIYQDPDGKRIMQHVQQERRKPNLPLQPILTSEFSLVRYISHPMLERNQPFLEQWVSHIQQWLGTGKQVYFFVHCPIEERSPHNAAHFQTMLETAKVEVPPLPWQELIATTPTQLRLF
jgi:uncharacterized protein YecE (DUF72 family)